MNWTPRRLGFVVALAVFLSVPELVLAATEEARLLTVFAKPREEGLPVGVISTGRPYDVLGRRLAWTLVRQGSVRGWIRDLDAVDLPLSEPSFQPHPTLSPPPAQGSVGDWRSQSGLGGLLTFALGDRENLAKMSDPYHRERIPTVTDHWGPLFYRRTRDYYVRGIYLWDLDQERIRLGLFKRRLYYENLLGSLGSEQALENALNSAPGWRGNRDVFGRGREYYLELSIHF